MEAKLRVLMGKAKGREIPLPCSQFIIGRDSACHLRPHSGMVSKFHCVIGRNAAGDVVLRDLKSSNKTHLNGQPITGTVRVKNGDQLRVGPLQFEFLIDPDAEISCNGTINAEGFHWLMEESPDAFDLDSDTTVIGLPAVDFDGEGDDAERNDDSHADETAEAKSGLSGGRYLREFIESQEQSPKPR